MGLAVPARRVAVVGAGDDRADWWSVAGERAELERLRAEARESDKRICELEMVRDVCT